MYTIWYGERKITFERQNSGRRMTFASKRLTIKITPERNVIVVACPRFSDTQVKQAVEQKGQWICKTLDRLEQRTQHLAPRHSVTGEIYYYLGQQYSLRIIEDKTRIPFVRLTDTIIEVSLLKNDPIVVRTMLEAWYKKQAVTFFQQRLEHLLEKTVWVKKKPVLKVAFLKSRWGSCSSKGIVNLNIHLIKASVACIDYVILHELCHFAEMNHSKRFYDLLTTVMPDWKIMKKYLNDYTTAFLLS